MQLVAWIALAVLAGALAGFAGASLLVAPVSRAYTHCLGLWLIDGEIESDG